jgi:fatty acid desaturase
MQQNQSSTININDPVFKPQSSRNSFQKFILRFIRDERDLPFIFLCLKITFIVLPIGIFLFIPGCFRWWLGIIYLVTNMVIGLGPFILMLHNTSHRKLFKEKYNFLNYYIPYILGPFYGEAPETYFHHHVIMHHVENNVPPDISSTMYYRRDSVRAFLAYFFRFFFLVTIEITIYFIRKKRIAFIKKVVAGEVGFFLFCILLSLFNWQATLIVFIIPYFISRLGMMAGNWAQHAFIDQTDPGNSFLNSINCINCGYNKRCFNDGYHIGHHLRPALHWTDMPTDFMKNISRYAEKNAIVFQGIDFFYIWLLLMTKNYNRLAAGFVDLNHTHTNRNDIIAFLKSRTRKFPENK